MGEEGTLLMVARIKGRLHVRGPRENFLEQTVEPREGRRIGETKEYMSEMHGGCVDVERLYKFL